MLKEGASCKSTAQEWALHIRKRRALLRHEVG